MKERNLIITIFILFILCSCANESTKEYPDVSENEKLSKRELMEQGLKADSIRMSEVLNEALEKAKPFTHKETYSREYILLEEDSNTIEVKIQIGQIFGKPSKNLVIHRKGKNDVFINIYSVKQQKVREILEHEEWSLPYISDTIQDINGDRRNDLVINGYGVNGCCLKAYSIAYLSKPNNEGFSNEFHFINPTFSPKEGVIRGVCYGHPGETEMYKYKWIGERIDTVEYVYFQTNDKGEKTGKVILSNYQPFGAKKNRKEKILEDVPAEYIDIYGFDWFMGNIE